MAQGQRAGLITPRSYDRNVSPVSIIISHRCIKALEQLFYRRGAAAARGAHNSEVTGSKRVAGIILFVCFTEALRHMLCDVKHSTFTGVAQRERAGLITPRSQDQSLSPVFPFGRFTEATIPNIIITPIAQLEEHHRRG